MNADLQHLIQLQELDTTAERTRRRIADAPAARAALEERLAARRAGVDAARARLAANQAARREVEKDLAAVQSRLSKFKNQLMEVKTNKEYQAMQKEMSVAEQEISDHETRLLERMEEADGLAAEVKAAEHELKADEAEVARELAALDAALTDAERELEKTMGERRAIAEQVSRGALAVFERVAHGRKGLAIAEARDGLCTVCHVRLRPQIFNEVRRNDSLIQCESCSRILFFIPSPSSVTQQT
jgi:predicted  nucleic acid-binding Zn-ribbon protein